MNIRRYVLPILILLYLFMASSCNNDKKFVEKGKESLKDNKQEQALAYFNKALEINPKNKEALINKGKIFLLKLETTQEADIYFEEVLKIDPENIEAWNGKGISYYNQKKDNQALECFNAVLSRDPNNIVSLRCKKLIFNNKGNAFMEEKQYKDAIKCYDTVLTIDPNDSDAKTGKELALKGKENSDCDSECIENLKKIGIALEMYAVENSNMYPKNLQILCENCYFKTLPQCPLSKIDYIYDRSSNCKDFSICCPNTHTSYENAIGYWPQYSPGLGIKLQP
ncbi:MAG: tetratricopeptide repeat protein [Candidatus Eremiobacterota bacterium]